MGNLLLLNGQQVSLASQTKSINFNGSTQYVSAADSTSFDSITTNMTLLCWVKGPVSDGNNQEILCKSDTHAGTDNEWSWNLYKNPVNTSGLFGVLITADGKPGGLQTKNYTSGTNVVFDNSTWNLIGFTFSSNTLTLYKNGVVLTPAIVTNATVNSIFVGTSNVSFGSRLNNNAIFAPYTGNGYAPAIWSTTLSTAAILSIYNSGNPIDLTVNQGNYTSSGSLVMYYKMAVPPDTVSSLADSSGNSNTGTGHNIVSFDNNVP